MKIINHELSSEEKSIIFRYFIFSKENAKKVMSDFALSTVKKYSNLYNHVQDLSDLRNASQNLDVVINLIWDNETNLTAQMECFGDRRYKDSYAKIKMFRFFNSDMSMRDMDGETAIMKLAKNPNNLRSITPILMESQNVPIKDSVVKNYGYNFFDFNDQGDNTITLALKTLTEKLVDYNPNQADFILECFEMLSGFKDAWMDKIQEVDDGKTKYFMGLAKKNIQLLLKCCDIEEKNPKKIFNYNYQYLKEEIFQVEKQVDNCLLKISLGHSLPEKVVENKIKKI